MISTLASRFSQAGTTITLMWDPSTDPTAVGYNVYYGVASRGYTNIIDAGNATSVIISNLVSGTLYYFAATTYNALGLESDYSAEASYAVPAAAFNVPPTLDQPSDLSLNENSSGQTVTLTGISSGSPTENQTLTVTAFSSNTGLIPNPTIYYLSPSPSGYLTFASAAGAYGSAVITVMVDDGGTVSNTIIRSFNVNVLPYNNPPTLDPITRITLSENAGPVTINLTGIADGAGENQPLTVTATSSNAGLMANPVVNYTSPSPTGTLTLTPLTNAFGWSKITVTVDDGQATNSSVRQTFVVQVQQADPSDTNGTYKAWSLWWQHTSGASGLWQMDGTNAVQTTRLNAVLADPGWRMAGMADLDGNGWNDILWQHTSGWVGLWLMNETNCIGYMRVGDRPAGWNWRLAGTGDLNGDGLADLLWQNTSSGLTAVWLMDGTNITAQIRLNAPLASAGWRLAATGDFNGDGKTDLLWQHDSGYTAVWLMDGTNCISYFRLTAPPADTGWRLAGVADINGVGHCDFLWQNDYDGRLGYWLMDQTNRIGLGRLNPGRVDPSWKIMGPR